MGGAIFAGGLIDLVELSGSSSVSHNTAAVDGGAIAAVGGVQALTSRASSMDNNTATQGGGGL